MAFFTVKKIVLTKNSVCIWTFILLVLFYQAKGVIYPEGIISQLIALIELSFCFFFVGKVLLNRFSGALSKVLVTLLVVTSLSFIFSPLSVRGAIIGEISTFTFFREIVGCILPFFPIYYFSRLNIISFLHLRILFGALFIISIGVFFHSYMVLTTEHNNSDVTNNEAYLFVSLLPYVIFFKKKWALLVIGLSFPLVILGAKRGAIVCYILGLLAYLIYFLRSDKHYFRNYFFCSILIVLLIFFSFYLYDTNPYLQWRLEETLGGNSSSRDYLITKIFDFYIKNIGVITAIWGYGFCHTVHVAGNYAHNDWVEYFFDMGLIGTICYATFYFNLILQTYLCKIQVYKYSLLVVIFTLLPQSLISMGVMREPSCFYFILLGYVLGKTEYLSKINIANYGKK